MSGHQLTVLQERQSLKELVESYEKAAQRENAAFPQEQIRSLQVLSIAQ